MKKWLLGGLTTALVLAAVWFAWVVFAPVSAPRADYSITIGPNRTLSQVARGLATEGVIRNREVMVALARLSGTDRKIKAGLYRFDGPVSMWTILQRFAAGNPDEASATVVEGWTFGQMRALLAKNPDLKHLTTGWSNERLMTELGADGVAPEGMFFPSTYYFTPGETSDLDILRRAYQTMQRKLTDAWQGRTAGLPLASPYQLLTLASLVEKETGKEADRPMIAAVFVNRLKKNMRLQTDPSVIYGLGNRYDGRLGKADLRHDTPYNTYTRNGLTPTPIALPGDAALRAAAQPASSDALYFVSRGDGSSYFSDTLAEHNGAVRKFILKKGN